MISSKVLKKAKRERDATSREAVLGELAALMYKDPMKTTVQDLIDILESRASLPGTLDKRGFGLQDRSITFEFSFFGVE